MTTLNATKAARRRGIARMPGWVALGVTLWLDAGATDCVAEAARSLELNLSAGVYTEQARVSTPLTLRIPTGTDPQRYAACLQLTGPDPSRAVMQTVKDARDCRRQATRTRLVRADPAAGQRIHAELDEARYAACVGHEIDVEVLAPGP